MKKKEWKRMSEREWKRKRQKKNEKNFCRFTIF
jgi:hypothetical protein